MHWERFEYYGRFADVLAVFLVFFLVILPGWNAQHTKTTRISLRRQNSCELRLWDRLIYDKKWNHLKNRKRVKRLLLLLVFLVLFVLIVFLVLLVLLIFLAPSGQKVSRSASYFDEHSGWQNLKQLQKDSFSSFFFMAGMNLALLWSMGQSQCGCKLLETHSPCRKLWKLKSRSLKFILQENLRQFHSPLTGKQGKEYSPSTSFKWCQGLV